MQQRAQKERRRVIDLTHRLHGEGFVRLLEEPGRFLHGVEEMRVDRVPVVWVALRSPLDVSPFRDEVAHRAAGTQQTQFADGPSPTFEERRQALRIIDRGRRQARRRPGVGFEPGLDHGGDLATEDVHVPHQDVARFPPGFGQ